MTNKLLLRVCLSCVVVGSLAEAPATKNLEYAGRETRVSRAANIAHSAGPITERHRYNHKPNDGLYDTRPESGFGDRLQTNNAGVPQPVNKQPGVLNYFQTTEVPSQITENEHFGRTFDRLGAVELQPVSQDLNVQHDDSRMPPGDPNAEAYRQDELYANHQTQSETPQQQKYVYSSNVQFQNQYSQAAVKQNIHEEQQVQAKYKLPPSIYNKQPVSHSGRVINDFQYPLRNPEETLQNQQNYKPSVPPSGDAEETPSAIFPTAKQNEARTDLKPKPAKHQGGKPEYSSRTDKYNNDSKPKVTQSSSTYQQPSGNQETYSYHYHPYAFRWVINHEPSYNYYRHEQSLDDKGSTKGSYKVNLPDGRVQNVDFVADPLKGYVAEVKYTGEATYPATRNKGTDVVNDSNAHSNNGSYNSAQTVSTSDYTDEAHKASSGGGDVSNSSRTGYEEKASNPSHYDELKPAPAHLEYASNEVALVYQGVSATEKAEYVNYGESAYKSMAPHQSVEPVPKQKSEDRYDESRTVNALHGRPYAEEKGSVLPHQEHTKLPEGSSLTELALERPYNPNPLFYPMLTPVNLDASGAAPSALENYQQERKGDYSTTIRAEQGLEHFATAYKPPVIPHKPTNKDEGYSSPWPVSPSGPARLPQETQKHVHEEVGKRVFPPANLNSIPPRDDKYGEKVSTRVMAEDGIIRRTPSKPFSAYASYPKSETSNEPRY